jgi:predicted nuclease of predicted toxin-antitoxin system
VRIKLDENVHGDVRDALAARGHDVRTAHDERLGGRPDADVGAAAKGETRCLVTFDLDFADPRRFPPAGSAGLVVLRLRIPTAIAGRTRDEVLRRAP